MRPADGAYIPIAVPTGAPTRTPVKGRVEGTTDTEMLLKRSGEDDGIDSLSTFCGIRLSLAEFVLVLSGLETVLRPLITTEKVVKRGRVLLKRWSG